MTLRHFVGVTRGAQLGGLMVCLGLALVAYGVAWQVGIAPGSRLSLPEPVALTRATPDVAVIPPTSAPGTAALVEMQAAVPAAAEVAPTVPVSTVAPVPEIVAQAGPLHAADREDHITAAAVPRPGYATRLAIPSIKLDTEVKQGGVMQNRDGEPEWETLPFVAVHYGDLTALVGGRGNAVIAGHVVTLNEGNVFRFLYQVDLGERVEVWDDRGVLHPYEVTDVKLVDPTDVSVMEQTPESTLTLITCGGTFDPTRREFSKRLIVTARLVAG